MSYGPTFLPRSGFTSHTPRPEWAPKDIRPPVPFGTSVYGPQFHFGPSLCVFVSQSSTFVYDGVGSSYLKPNHPRPREGSPPSTQDLVPFDNPILLFTQVGRSRPVFLVTIPFWGPYYFRLVGDDPGSPLSLLCRPVDQDKKKKKTL